VPGCAASLLFIEVSPDHSYCRVCAATLHFEPHAAAFAVQDHDLDLDHAPADTPDHT
jgi:hypothetical protein